MPLLQIERLVQSVKPMCGELEMFKGKITEFQELIRKGLDEALSAESATRTSVASFCRLSEVERELHRQAAGSRLQDMANNWELSRITEGSNVSRSRISTVSLTGQMGRMSVTNLPVTLEDASNAFVFEEEAEAANQSFISHIPRMTASRTNNHFKKLQDPHLMSGADGDHPLVSDAQDTEPQHVPQSEDTILCIDELTDMLQVEEVPKPEKRKPKSSASRAGCSGGTRRQPRAKKTIVAAAAGSGDNMEPGADFVMPVVRSESLSDIAAEVDEVNNGQKLRPRRKGVNYRDVEGASAVTPKKKPVKRTKKAAPPEK